MYLYTVISIKKYLLTMAGRGYVLRIILNNSSQKGKKSRKIAAGYKIQAYVHGKLLFGICVLVEQSNNQSKLHFKILTCCLLNADLQC